MWLLQTSVSHHSLTNMLNWSCQRKVPLHPSHPVQPPLVLSQALVRLHPADTLPEHLCWQRGKEGGTGPPASIAGLKHLSNHQC